MHVFMSLPQVQQPTSNSIALRGGRVTVLLLATFIFVSLSLYIHRMSVQQEEPRRCLIAQEMLLNREYVTPTVFQRPYLKKPPLHNWVVALAAGPDRSVSHTEARMVSILSFLLLGTAVYLTLRPYGRERAMLGFFACTTNYLLLCEFGNRAESDMLFALLIFVSYALYVRQPRRWPFVLLSSLFMGMGILTKGFAPLFFYPGLLAAAWFDGERRGRQMGGLAVHFALSLILPALWAAALHQRGSLELFFATGTSEIADKTFGDAWKWLGHLVYFPARTFVVLLPWTLVGAVAFRPVRRRSELYRTSLWIGITSFAFLTLAAGSRDRYILPLIPFVALFVAHHIDPRRFVPRRLSQIVLVLVALATATAAGAQYYWGQLLPATILTVCAMLAILLSRRTYVIVDFALVFALLAFSFHEHFTYYYQTVRKGSFDPMVEEIAREIDADLPLVVEERIEFIHLSFYIESQLGRRVFGRGVADFDEYCLITDREHVHPEGKEVLTFPNLRRTGGHIVLQHVGRASATDGN